jgi:hypothetical protein
MHISRVGISPAARGPIDVPEQPGIDFDATHSLNAPKDDRKANRGANVVDADRNTGA